MDSSLHPSRKCDYAPYFFTYKSVSGSSFFADTGARWCATLIFSAACVPLVESAQAAVAEHHRQRGFHNRLFSHGFGQMFEIKVQGLVSGERLACGRLSPHSAFPLSSNRKRSGVSSSSLKDTSPIGSGLHPYELI